ncbi:cytochrome P450, partial [Glonium stellatum]
MASFIPQSSLQLILYVCAVCLLYGIVKLVKHRRFYKDLPKPPHSFLFGHLKLLGEIIPLFPPNCHPQVWYTTLAQKYKLPGIFYLDLWPLGPAQLIITDPDLADQVTVLRSYPKHIENEIYLTPLVDKRNIAASNGPTWKLLHSMLSPAFAPSNIKNLVGVMADETMMFCETLSRYAETNEVFSMEQTAAKLIFDIVGKAVFSFPLNAQTTGSACLKDLQEILKYGVLARESKIPLTKFRAESRRKAAMKRADAYIESKIRERYEYLKSENISVAKKNALSILDLILRDRLQPPSSSNNNPNSNPDPLPRPRLPRPRHHEPQNPPRRRPRHDNRHPLLR